jgi:hypothetical protein
VVVVVIVVIVIVIIVGIIVYYIYFSDDNNFTPSRQSQSITASNKLFTTMKKLHDSSIDVYIHDEAIAIDDDVQDLLQMPAVLEWSGVHDSLQLGCEEREPTENIDFVELLNKTSESECQEKMGELAGALEAADSSKGTCGLVFTTPRDMVIGEEAKPNYYPLSGNADLVSTIAPQAIEIKASGSGKKPHSSGNTETGELDSNCSSSSSSSSASSSSSSAGGISSALGNRTVEALAQSLERLFNLRSTACQLAHAVVYSITASHAFMLVFCREYKYGTGSLDERIKIYRIPHSDVLKHWMAINRLRDTNPHWFLTSDGFALNQRWVCTRPRASRRSSSNPSAARPEYAA